jgi:hypothetical protein
MEIELKFDSQFLNNFTTAYVIGTSEWVRIADLTWPAGVHTPFRYNPTDVTVLVWISSCERNASFLSTRVLPEKLIITQLDKKFPSFYGTSCSQQPATGPYPEPDESSPHLLTEVQVTLQVTVGQSVRHGVDPCGTHDHTF